MSDEGFAGVSAPMLAPAAGSTPAPVSRFHRLGKSKMPKLIIALSVLGLITGSAPVAAATHCRDAKGKFVKCTKASAAKATRCKDAKGKFAKCGTPAAKPA